MALTKIHTPLLGTAAPNAVVKLQVDSTAQGFLPPRATTARRRLSRE